MACQREGYCVPHCSRLIGTGQIIVAELTTGIEYVYVPSLRTKADLVWVDLEFWEWCQQTKQVQSAIQVAEQMKADWSVKATVLHVLACPHKGRASPVETGLQSVERRFLCLAGSPKISDLCNGNELLALPNCARIAVVGGAVRVHLVRCTDPKDGYANFTNLVEDYASLDTYDGE